MRSFVSYLWIRLISDLITRQYIHLWLRMSLREPPKWFAVIQTTMMLVEYEDFILFLIDKKELGDTGQDIMWVDYQTLHTPVITHVIIGTF